MNSFLRTGVFLLFLATVAACGTSRPVAEVERRSAEPAPSPPAEAAAPAPAPPAGFLDVAAVRAGRFDDGKMWTFDNPPLEYFRETYDFEPDEAWFTKARLGSLRFSEYCSASFVSPRGLILTNHHCARESITNVSGTGENLLDNGFYGITLEDERRVEDLFVEQLISIEDITGEVRRALGEAGTAEERLFAREQIIGDIEERMTDEAGGDDEGMRVQIISLYHGGQYSAYTFRRIDDIRLVAAPELELGHFGGDPDNFTYPRYSLDFTFFRAYDAGGRPMETPEHFSWSFDGAQDGDAVFVIGNPGSTSRLNTVAQLEFTRDYELPFTISLYEDRVEILRAFDRENRELSEDLGVRNLVFSLDNAIKASRGRLEGLHDPVLMARRRDSERRFREAIEQNPSLREEYGHVFDEIAELQQRREQLADRAAAFSINATLGSVILARAIYGVFHSLHLGAGATEDDVQDLRKEMENIRDRPGAFEEEILTAQFRFMQEHLGDGELMQNVLAGRSPEERARAVVANSALADSAAFMQMVGPDFMHSNDPAVAIVRHLVQPLVYTQYESGIIDEEEEELTSQLALARFEIYGTSIPPDATFSPRIADGVVRGYPYNGTIAAPFTTYHGLFERNSVFQNEYPWTLPQRWLDASGTMNLEARLNLVSTNDIVGGNSGSPLLNANLEIVGLVFDGNIESLPGEFIYTDERARCISVDARGIIEALDSVMNAGRIVSELRSGELAGAGGEKAHTAR